MNVYLGLLDFLDFLDLSDEHKTALLERGFTSEQIEICQYKTMPRRTQYIMPQFVKNHDVEGVPGFFQMRGEAWGNNKKKKDAQWALSSAQGTLIPVRDFSGNILALRVRSDSDSPSGRYTTVSSNPKSDNGNAYPSGTTAKNHIHYPLQKPEIIETLRITEGEFKADLTNFYLDGYTISLPGVTSWELGLEAVKKLNPKKVVLAFDADKNQPRSTSVASNEVGAVGKSLSNLYLAIKNLGINVVVEHWGADYGKGIDDVIMNGHDNKIIEWSEDEAEEFCKKSLGDQSIGWSYIFNITAVPQFKTT